MHSKKLSEIELYEKVDIQILRRLMGAPELKEIVRNQLTRYYSRKLSSNVVPVSYFFSENLKTMGRLYAGNSLSLQSFKRRIRHVLSKDIYFDVDMVNAHPVLLLQYCNKQEPPIKCKFLNHYVANRDKILTRLENLHEISRDKAKKLMLRIFYQGNYKIKKNGKKVDPEVPLKFVISFQKELKRVSAIICDKEKDIYSIVKEDESKKNKSSSTVSILVDTLEHKCLMSMYKFFTKKKSCAIGVLCFDGLMVEKTSQLTSSNIEEVLRECEKFVLDDTGYSLSLANKPMNEPLAFELSPLYGFIENDSECQEQLFKLEGSNKFKFCEGTLYIFDERTGIFDTKIEVLNYYLSKNKDYLHKLIGTIKQDGTYKTISYGVCTQLRNEVVPFVKEKALDDRWVRKVANSSLGYLLFKDGIYNMKKSTFTKGFDESIVFYARVDRDFPVVDEKQLKYAMDLSFDSFFDKDGGIRMIVALEIALAGDIQVKKFYLCPGNSNAGKSSLSKMLVNAFGNYVGTVNAESFTDSKNTSDEGQKNRWALLVRFCRILCSNELNMTKTINSNEIKKHSSGGDLIVGRNHFSNEISFVPHYTIFCMVNDIPEIKPLDNATHKRLEYIKFPNLFCNPGDDDYIDSPHIKPKIDSLNELIEKPYFIDGFITILLNGYKHYLENGMPQSDSATKNEWTEGEKQSEIIVDLIKEYFTITNEKTDMVPVSVFKNFRKTHSNILGTISLAKFNEILINNLKLTKGRNTKGIYWSGIKEGSS